uniref:Uncharacterized protein n=1 Tax=Alexandrium andersonii TaxID=327968 RepID=A0A7S2AYR6_9DINO
MAAALERQHEEAMCEVLSDQHSFVLCDARVSGFPIRHASDGFKEMFRCGTEGSTARGEKLDACSSIMDSEAAVVAASREAGLSTPDVVKALQLLEDMAAETCREVSNGERALKADSVLLVKAKRGGDMFVCMLSVALHRHPMTGWSFLVGLHKDMTCRLQVRDLLQAASLGRDSVQAQLRGLLAQERCQQALLEHPASISHLNEAFHKVSRDFLVGLSTPSAGHSQGSKPRGSKGSRGDNSSGSSTHTKKQKPVRSEASAATTASNVSVRRRPNSDSHTSLLAAPVPAVRAEVSVKEVVAPMSDVGPVDIPQSPLAVHLLELLEPVDLEPLPTPVKRLATESQDSNDCVKDECNLASKKELRELDFPMVVFDPSQPGLPAVLCSAGFHNHVDCPVREVDSLQSKTDGLGLRDILRNSDAEECEPFCEAASRGEFYASSKCAAGLTKYGAGTGQSLAAGELLCSQAAMTRSGESLDSMVYLKQVELDEKMYIVCLQAEIPEDDEAAAKLSEAQLLFAGEGANTQTEDRRWLAYLCLDERMDTLIQALAAHFWFSAPMRRQTVCVEDFP